MLIDQLKKQNLHAESSQRIGDLSRDNIDPNLFENQDTTEKQQKQEQHDQTIVRNAFRDIVGSLVGSLTLQ
ncbi:hypothetical protein SADUNF_Sadunf11G0050400 [Salix dunnii]|uniref:Uncharacterized protein n=1 Tax=Salix dunnii TaxID=1413687 RepID=A0A835MT53_9ROSI|nr:hypothetical protein SADUNF_Sadunf11G0050400 [Salix dunnii]